MSFPGFIYEFTNSPISVAFPSYLALNLTAATSPTLLYWPTQQPYEPTPFSNNMFIISNDTVGNVIRLPDASLVSTAQSSIIANYSGNNAVLEDFTGATIGTITATMGISYYLVLTSNSSQAGVWKLIPFGTASLTPIDVGDLVDAHPNTINGNVLMEGGLAAIADTETAAPGTYLKVNTRVQNYASATGAYVQTQGDRGTLMVVTGASSFTYSLLSAAEAGNGFIFSMNNTTPSTGGGSVTLATQAGDTIDFNTLNPSNSASWISDGVSKWTSLGLGINTTPSSFTNVTISLAAGSNTSPPLSFYTDTTGLGLFYNSAIPSMEIVQSYLAPGPVPVTIAQFYASATQTLGYVTLATNSSFSGTSVNLLNVATFNPTDIIIGAAATTDITLTATSAIDVTAPDVSLISSSSVNAIAPDINLNASTAVNMATPSVQQEGISIYSLMRAYS